MCLLADPGVVSGGPFTANPKQVARAAAAAMALPLNSQCLKYIIRMVEITDFWALQVHTQWRCM